MSESDSGEEYRRFGKLFDDLARPFPDGAIKSRRQAGREFSYITARTVMNRLDEVVGPDNWWDHYEPWGASGVHCSLTIRLPDGTTLSKEDVGAVSSMSKVQKDANDGDDAKGGFSDAFKRAAVKFGIGRHLYDEGGPPPSRGREDRRDRRPARDDSPADVARDKWEAKSADPKTSRYHEWISGFVSDVNGKVREKRNLPSEFKLIGAKALQECLRSAAVESGMIGDEGLRAEGAGLTAILADLYAKAPEDVRDMAVAICKGKIAELGKAPSGA